MHNQELFEHNKRLKRQIAAQNEIKKKWGKTERNFQRITQGVKGGKAAAAIFTQAIIIIMLLLMLMMMSDIRSLISPPQIYDDFQVPVTNHEFTTTTTRYVPCTSQVIGTAIATDETTEKIAQPHHHHRCVFFFPLFFSHIITFSTAQSGQIFTVGNGPYASQYVFRCLGVGQGWTGHELRCPEYNEEMASIPSTNAVNMVQAKANGLDIGDRIYFGAKSFSNNVWQWTHGRMKGITFSNSSACQPYIFRPYTKPHSVFHHCNWAVAEPAINNQEQCMLAPFSGDTVLRWVANSCAQQLECVLCERSLCTYDVDCLEANTEAMTGNGFPNCDCACKPGYFGAGCELPLVTSTPTRSSGSGGGGGGPSSSPSTPTSSLFTNYSIVCDAYGMTYANAQSVCRTHTGGNAAAGSWTLAAVPTAAIHDALKRRIPRPFTSAWIAAEVFTNLAGSGTFKWRNSGRLNGTQFAYRDFFSAPQCDRSNLTYGPAIVFEYDPYCPWDRGAWFPAGRSCAFMSGLDFNFTFANCETASRSCAVCERSQCAFAIDCNTANALYLRADVLNGGPTYYPHCSCVCKPRFTGPRCDKAVTLTAELSFLTFTRTQTAPLPPKAHTPTLHTLTPSVSEDTITMTMSSSVTVSTASRTRLTQARTTTPTPTGATASAPSPSHRTHTTSKPPTHSRGSAAPTPSGSIARFDTATVTTTTSRSVLTEPHSKSNAISPTAEKSITVTLIPIPPPVLVQPIPAEVTAAATSAAVAVGGATAAVDAQALAIIGLVDCGANGIDTDEESTRRNQPHGYRSISPFALEDSCHGVLQGNAVALCIVAVLSVAFVVVVKKAVRKDLPSWKAAMSLARAPHFFILFATMLMNSFAVCGTTLLRAWRHEAGISESTSLRDAQLGGLSWFVAVLIALSYPALAFLFCSRRLQFIEYCWAEEDEKKKSSNIIIINRKRLAELFLPLTQLDASYPSGAAFGAIVGPLRRLGAGWTLTSLLSFFATIPIVFGERRSCVPLFSVSAAMYFSFALFIAITRPRRALVNDVLHSSVLLLNGCLMAVSAALLLSPRTTVLEVASEGIAAALTGLTFVRVGVTVVAILMRQLILRGIVKNVRVRTGKQMERWLLLVKERGERKLEVDVGVGGSDGEEYDDMELALLNDGSGGELAEGGGSGAQTTTRRMGSESSQTFFDAADEAKVVAELLSAGDHEEGREAAERRKAEGLEAKEDDAVRLPIYSPNPFLDLILTIKESVFPQRQTLPSSSSGAVLEHKYIAYCWPLMRERAIAAMNDGGGGSESDGMGLAAIMSVADFGGNGDVDNKDSTLAPKPPTDDFNLLDEDEDEEDEEEREEDASIEEEVTDEEDELSRIGFPLYGNHLITRTASSGGGTNASFLYTSRYADTRSFRRQIEEERRDREIRKGRSLPQQ